MAEEPKKFDNSRFAMFKPKDKANPKQESSPNPGGGKKGFNPKRLAFLQKLQQAEESSNSVGNSRKTSFEIKNSDNNDNDNDDINISNAESDSSSHTVPSQPSANMLKSVPKPQPRKSDGNFKNLNKSKPFGTGRTNKVHSAFGAGLNINMAALRPGATYVKKPKKDAGISELDSSLMTRPVVNTKKRRKKSRNSLSLKQAPLDSINNSYSGGRMSVVSNSSFVSDSLAIDTFDRMIPAISEDTKENDHEIRFDFSNNNNTNNNISNNNIHFAKSTGNIDENSDNSMNTALINNNNEMTEANIPVPHYHEIVPFVELTDDNNNMEGSIEVTNDNTTLNVNGNNSDNIDNDEMYDEISPFSGGGGGVGSGYGSDTSNVSNARKISNIFNKFNDNNTNNFHTKSISKPKSKWKIKNTNSNINSNITHHNNHNNDKDVGSSDSDSVLNAEPILDETIEKPNPKVKESNETNTKYENQTDNKIINSNDEIKNQSIETDHDGGEIVFKSSHSGPPTVKSVENDILRLQEILEEKREQLARLQRKQLTDKMENMRPIAVMKKLGKYCEFATKEQLELLRKVMQFSKNHSS